VRLKDSRGFTLLEVLLSTGIITVLVGLSLPVYQSFQNRNDLDIAADSITLLLRRAQVYAEGMNQDSAWGVEIQSGVATLFKGTSFAARNTAYDEPVDISEAIAVSGLGEVLFSKFSATPNTTGSVTLTSINNDIRTIAINAKGTVSY